MPKQTEIPGTERKKIKALTEAAEAYVEARDKRMALTKNVLDVSQSIKVKRLGDDADDDAAE